MAAHILPLAALFFGLYIGSQSQETLMMNMFQETFRNYTTTANNVILTINEILLNRTTSITVFLSEIDYSPLVTKARTMDSDCRNIRLTLNELQSFVKNEFIKLETPLLKRKISIKERLADISSSLIIYTKLAENKLQACKLQGTSCPEVTNNWLNEKISSLICRVIPDCKNHTISKRSISDKNFFDCGFNWQPIPGTLVCDGDNNCPNGADEHPDCQKHCFEGFHCRNLKCIDKLKICNEVDDCDDSSDEENCPPKEILYSTDNCNVQTGNYLCENKKCVSLTELCDGIDDCGDNSDEEGQCGLNGSCSAGCTVEGGICFGSPKGALCLNRCPQGMSESRGQCVQGPETPAASLAELLEGVPRLLERYAGSVNYLKQRVVTKLHEALESCQPSQHIESISPSMLNNSMVNTK